MVKFLLLTAQASTIVAWAMFMWGVLVSQSWVAVLLGISVGCVLAALTVTVWEE